MRYKGNIAPGNNAVIAAALSFIIPGAGKIYLKGFRDGFVGFILWFIFVTTGYVFLFLPGLILHIICVFTAYNSAFSSMPPQKRNMKPLMVNIPVLRELWWMKAFFR